MPRSTNQVLELTELPSTMTLPGSIQDEGSTNHVEERPSLLSPDTAQRQRDASHARSESTTATTVANSEDEPPFTLRTQKEIGVGPRQDRLVSRRLKGINIFMITINATLGTGLYWRGGQILELGGSLAVVLAFLLVGCLVWAVMQCISEMLCIWPIPGALSVYVSKFVDQELGIAVGIAYWFSWSMSFSTLLATLAAEFNFWHGLDTRTFHGLVTFSAVAIILTTLNLFKIQIYGSWEVVTGTLKLLFLVIIIIILGIINGGGQSSDAIPIHTTYWTWTSRYDSRAADNWVTALFMGISVATFSYVGVEVVAACALEARWPRQKTDPRAPSDESSSPKQLLIGNTVKFSAIWISAITTVVYTLSGLLASLDINSTDCELPRVSWIEKEDHCLEPNSQSAFVMIAQKSGIPHMADVFNVFLLFTCLSCACTSLYIASRALFGLASQLQGGKGQPWHIRLLSLLGKTDHRKVPRNAVIFSAACFLWVPYLQLIQTNDGESKNSINTFVETLAEMSSDGVLIVWACEAYAFIRYHHCTCLIMDNQDSLDPDDCAQVQRSYNKYPYRSHGQPLVAWIALTGCIFVLFVVNGSPLWNGFHLLPFLAAYLTIIAFVGLWIFLKLNREAKWSLVDLSRPNRVVDILRSLHEMCAATIPDERDGEPSSP